MCFKYFIMAGNITFTMIKPEAVTDLNIGAITQKIEQGGFEIIAMKMTRLSKEKAGEFYMVHKERPFYSDLLDFMTECEVVPMVLEKEDAVKELREVIGATDPAEAEEGTVRKLYADNKQNNIIHASDSAENAKIEIAFFFSKKDIIDNQ